EILGSESTDGTFTGTHELSTKLAASAEVQSCFALQWWRYAHGAEESAAEQCGVDRIADGFRTKNLSIEELIVSIVLEESFHARLDDGTASSTPTPSGDAGSPEDSTPA